MFCCLEVIIMDNEILTSEILSDFDITTYSLKKESDKESEDSDEDEGISLLSLTVTTAALEVVGLFFCVCYATKIPLLN